MKKPVYAATAIFLFSILFFPFNLSAQLTDQEKMAMNVYIETSPSFSKYEKSVKEKVLSDPQVITEIKGCWSHIKKYTVLENCKKIEDLSTMYSELGQGVPELRNKCLPDFNRTDYKNTMLALPGNTIKMDATKHAALLNYYYADRKDRLDPQNTFGSLIIQYPELIEELRKAAYAATNKNMDDPRLNLWLEMNYYQQMRLNAIKQIGVEEKDIHQLIDECLISLPGKFEEVAIKENNTPQNWTGTFANENITVKFEQRGDFTFGRYDKSIGSASESAQWNLTVKENKADGDWTVIYMDDDKTIKRIGTLTVKLDGDVMTFDMLGTDWSIEWKPNVKPYDTETAATTKGIKMNGTLTRKK